MRNIVFGSIIVILIVFLYFIYKPIRYNPKFISDTHIAIENTRYRIPHIFWGYWHDPHNIPNVVNECFISWRRNYPTYSIIIVNNNTISKYINRDELPNKFEEIKAHQMRSDFIRLALLKKYGGIWIDASILMMKPIEPIWLDHKYDLAVFNQPLHEIKGRGKLVPENWFISAPKNSKIIKLWKDEFTHGVDDFNTIDDYYKNIEKEYQINLSDFLTYLSMYASFMVIEKKNPEILPNIYVEAANGPNNPVDYYNGNVMSTCFLFLNNFYFNKYNQDQYMFKLTTYGRFFIDELSTISHKNSIIRVCVRDNAEYLKGKR